MVELRKVTFEMYDEFVKLSVHEHQENFVASAPKSLAQAYLWTTNEVGSIVVYGIFADNVLVGFVKYCFYPDEELFEPNCYHIWRLLIDKAHQGKGYGRQTIEKVIAEIKTRPFGEVDSIYVSYEPENAASKALFASFGFVETDKKFSDDNDEIIARLKIA